jgi:hypothetical protein
MITSFIRVTAAGDGMYFITKHTNSFILTLIVKMSYCVVFKDVFPFLFFKYSRKKNLMLMCGWFRYIAHRGMLSCPHCMQSAVALIFI